VAWATLTGLAEPAAASDKARDIGFSEFKNILSRPGSGAVSFGQRRTSMAADDVVPRVGIKVGDSRMVQLGMPREASLALLAGHPDIELDFRGDPPVVAFIQSPKHWGTFDGIELFESAADEVVAEIARRRGLDPGAYGPGRHHY